MADNKDITESSSQSVQSMETKGSETSIDNFEHRRRILKGAAVVAPLMMTVASRPALGWGGGRCQGLSGKFSGNLSNHKDEYCDCGGHGIRYWKDHDWGGTGCDKGSGDWSRKNNTWGGSYWSKDSKSGSDGTPFHQYSRLSRRRGIFSGRYFQEKSMMEVLSSDRDDPYDLGKYCVVAYLNAKTVSGYPLTPEEVVKVYDSLRKTGYYDVAGHRMTAPEFVMYVKYTITGSDGYSWDRWNRH